MEYIISTFIASYKLKNAMIKKKGYKNIMHIIIVILIFSAILYIKYIPSLRYFCY